MVYIKIPNQDHLLFNKLLLKTENKKRMGRVKSLILSDLDIQSINLWISKMNHYKDVDRKQKIKNAQSILQLKYKRIGAGSSRIVYDLENGYVLKVALSEGGVKCNETEFNIFTNCPPDLREHLCPVKEFGCSWNIMKKMIPKIPVNEIYNEKLSELNNKFRKYGIIPRDTNNNNLALSKKGEIIVIDYGHFIMASPA
jgi:hypothetical protein